MEMVKEIQEEVVEQMVDVLKGYSFKKCYGSKSRLTPVVNKKQTTKTKERIKRCQVHHKKTWQASNMSSKILLNY